MPEHDSRTAAAIAAGTKVIPAEANGKVRVVTFRTPATHTMAQNDTMVGGVLIPKNAVIIPIATYGHSGMGASVTIDVGLRNFHTQVVLDADGLVAARAVTTAIEGTLELDGALTANLPAYTVTEDSEIVVTFGGGTPTANGQLWIGLLIASTD